MSMDEKFPMNNISIAEFVLLVSNIPHFYLCIVFIIQFNIHTIRQVCDIEILQKKMKENLEKKLKKTFSYNTRDNRPE